MIVIILIHKYVLGYFPSGYGRQNVELVVEIMFTFKAL